MGHIETGHERVRDTHVASSVVDVLRVATDGGARELLRVVLGEARGAAGGCAVVGAVDGARAADLFGELKMILLVGGAMPPWLSTRHIFSIPFLIWSASCTVHSLQIASEGCDYLAVCRMLHLMRVS